MAGALVAAIALALTSCTGPDAARPSPSLSTTGASASPTPSRSTPPERPAAMDRSDVEGAIAAAQYFLELYPYAYNTGDLTAWKAMSHPECVFCASVIENVETLHAAGGYEVGGEIVIESVTASDPVEGNEFFAVDVTLSQFTGTRHSADGRADQGIGNVRATAYFAVGSIPGGWIIREATIESLS